MLRGNEKDTQRPPFSNNGDLIKPLWSHNGPARVTLPAWDGEEEDFIVSGVFV